MIRKILFLVVFVFGVLIGLLISNFSITGDVVQKQENYSYTTAICSPEKKCIDVFVECSNGEVVSLMPASNLIQHEAVWNDFRDGEDFCG